MEIATAIMNHRFKYICLYFLKFVSLMIPTISYDFTINVSVYTDKWVDALKEREWIEYLEKKSGLELCGFILMVWNMIIRD